MRSYHSTLVDLCVEIPGVGSIKETRSPEQRSLQYFQVSIPCIQSIEHDALWFVVFTIQVYYQWGHGSVLSQCVNSSYIGVSFFIMKPTVPGSVMRAALGLLQ